MRTKTGISIVFILILLAVNPLIQAEESQIESLYFKETQIREVLRTLAEAAGVNLVTDGSVSGKTTVNLKGISFKKALKLVTNTHNLDYYWDKDTVVIAGPDRIREMYESEKSKTITLKSIKVKRAQKIVKKIMPELAVITHPHQQKITLIGGSAKVEKMQKLLVKVEKNIELPRERKATSRIISVRGLNQKLLKNDLSKLFPDLKIKGVQNNKMLRLKGSHKNIEGASKYINKIRSCPQLAIKTLYYDYLTASNLKVIFKKFLPTVNYQILKPYKKVIVKGKPEQIQEAVNLLKTQDRPRRQIIIEARVEEVSQNRLKKLGVSPQQLSQLKILRKNNKIKGMKITWPQFIELLQDRGISRTLANPSLMTVNGKQAQMLIGDRIPVEVEKIEDGEAVQSIDYIKAGINLVFKPWITRNNRIKLEISPKVSSIGSSLSNGLPTINTREVNTEVILENEQTLVIAGLIQDDYIKNMSAIPGLSQIPIFGQIFKHQQTQKIKTEVLITITPKIVTTAATSSK